MIRYIAHEDVLDMSNKLRAAAKVLDTMAIEILNGTEILDGMSPSDVMMAVRAFSPIISSISNTVGQLHASVIKRPDNIPPASQPYEDEQYNPASQEYQVEEDKVQRPLEFPLDDATNY